MNTNNVARNHNFGYLQIKGRLSVTFKERQAHIVEMHELNKQIAKEILEENKKPWWVKEQESGDYHYNSWDMEPAQEEE